MKKLIALLTVCTVLFYSCDGDSGGPSTPAVDINPGCTDPLADNFDPNAESDDCDCTYAGFSAIGTPPPSAEKNVLIEDFTGEWCGWCVDATVITDRLVEENPGRVFVNAIHRGDFLQTAAANTVMEDFEPPFFPSGMVNRSGQSAVSRDLWSGYTSLQLREEATLDIAIETKMVDSNTLEGVVHVDFKENLGTSEFLLHIYLTESNIEASGQRNYYSRLDGAQDHPYYDKSGILRGEDYIHNNVLKQVIGTYTVANKAARNEGVFTRKFSVGLSNYDNNEVEILAFVTWVNKNNVFNVIGVSPDATTDW